MKVLIEDMDLFILRATAAEWLAEHGLHLNAPAVLRTLRATQEDKGEKDDPRRVQI